MGEEQETVKSLRISQLSTKLPLIFGSLGLLLITLALLIEYVKSIQTRPATLGDQSGRVFTGAPAQDFSRKIIKVDIEGAVERPGLYEIPDDSRMQDVLITAGGLTAKADRTYLSVNINLAQHLFDGQKIYLPEAGENLPKVTNNPLSQANPVFINLNSASVSDLDTLPGIGPVTADKIITGRPYQTTSQLLERHLVSQAVYDKIKDKITVN